MARQQPVDVELASILVISRDGPGRPNLASIQGKATLPGQPRVRLEDEDGLIMYLKSAHLTPELDRLAPYLWLVSSVLRPSIKALNFNVSTSLTRRDLRVPSLPYIPKDHNPKRDQHYAAAPPRS